MDWAPPCRCRRHARSRDALVTSSLMAIARRTTSGNGATATRCPVAGSWTSPSVIASRVSTSFNLTAAGCGRALWTGPDTGRFGGVASAIAPTAPCTRPIAASCRPSWTISVARSDASTRVTLNQSPTPRTFVGTTRLSRSARRAMSTTRRTPTWTTGSAAVERACARPSAGGVPRTDSGNGVVAPVAEWIGHRLVAADALLSAGSHST